MQRGEVLGVPIDVLTEAQAIERIEWLLQSGEQHQVATPNPEIILAARSDAEFLRILRGCSLNIPDGAGIVWALRRSGFPVRERVTGTDMLQSLCRLAQGVNVFLLGARPGVAARAAEVLKAANPALAIAGTLAGSPSEDDEQHIVHCINESGAQLLFVAFGAPAQEQWIARNLSKMPGVRVAMGVGGAFDFVAGVRRRAPRWMRSMGLEWLFRLLHEPRRIGRIWNAVVVFPVTVLLSGSRKVG